MCLWNIALPSPIWPGGCSAMALARAIVSWSSLSGGATRLTSPSRSAVAASIDWPVNSMSSARLEPTLRPTGTEGVPQNRLRQAADRHHHGRAARQQVVVEAIVATRGDLAQIVAGRERATLGLDDD